VKGSRLEELSALASAQESTNRSPKTMFLHKGGTGQGVTGGFEERNEGPGKGGSLGV
jgi:hypothetical protein